MPDTNALNASVRGELNWLISTTANIFVQLCPGIRPTASLWWCVNSLPEVWRHWDLMRNLSNSQQTHMMTSSNGNIFHVTGPMGGKFPVTGEFPSQRSVMRSSDVFFYLCLNKRLRKHLIRRWLEKPSSSSWRHCNCTFGGTLLTMFTNKINLISPNNRSPEKHSLWWSALLTVEHCISHAVEFRLACVVMRSVGHMVLLKSYPWFNFRNFILHVKWTYAS